MPNRPQGIKKLPAVRAGLAGQILPVGLANPVAGKVFVVHTKKRPGMNRAVLDVRWCCRAASKSRREGYFSRCMRMMPSRYFSMKGSETPLRTLRRKYFSKAILARCTHLPEVDQLTLRGGFCGRA